MEYLDLDISYGNSTLRLVTTYRPPRSKKNCSTPATFFSALYTTGNSEPPPLAICCWTAISVSTWMLTLTLMQIISKICSSQQALHNMWKAPLFAADTPLTSLLTARTIPRFLPLRLWWIFHPITMLYSVLWLLQSPLSPSHNLYSVTFKTPSTWTLSRLTFWTFYSEENSRTVGSR